MNIYDENCCSFNKSNNIIYFKDNIRENNLQKETIIVRNGFYNYGSTCYFNSLIQVLYNIYDFRLSILYLESFVDPDILLSEIIKILKNLNKNYECHYYEPISFFENKNNIFYNNLNEQKDSSELLLYLFEHLDKVLNNINFGKNCEHILIKKEYLYTLQIDIIENGDLQKINKYCIQNIK